MAPMLNCAPVPKVARVLIAQETILLPITIPEVQCRLCTRGQDLSGEVLTASEPETASPLWHDVPSASTLRRLWK